jgi:dephospho-CoA kinase
MLRVALTGGVGSGKSTAAAIFAALGARVSQSDEIGRAMMQPGQAVFAAIVDHFGREVLTPAGTLDRAALSRIAFAQGRVEEINRLVHPAVIDAQAAWAAAVAAEDPAAVAIVESALVFETRHAGGTDRDGAGTPAGEQNGTDSAPWRSRFDRIVLVTAPEAVRRERYIERVLAHAPGADPATVAEDFAQRNAAQWPEERKAALADFVLVNDGSLAELRPGVERIYRALQAESAIRVTKTVPSSS